MNSINISRLSIYDFEKAGNIALSSRFSLIKNSLHIVVDQFVDADCFFIRNISEEKIEITVDDICYFQQASAGGYIAIPSKPNKYFFWIPLPATKRQTTHQNHVTSESNASIFSTVWYEKQISITLANSSANNLDFVIWRIKSNFLKDQLLDISVSESHPYFLWGSHANLKRPSDLYHHLIFGSVYDLRYSWPQQKRCFSENEAHALYTVYSGLEKTTGKTIYRYFQQQLVLSVIHRQSQNGGWYHGMWTDESESHYRLHTSGIHLLLDEYEKTKCIKVKTALEKAVSFLSKQTDNLECGIWFLHDSLELSEQAMNSGPFHWIPSRTLGKSVSNMLVLNTHLDATIAINRYSKLTGDQHYDKLIRSALQSTRTVLSLNPVDWLYKPLFWAIGLTMLPTEIAKKLPLPIRVIKRIAAQYLIKKLPDIKLRFPRLVMPNGYIDRELSLRTWAIDYQTINLMDLSRYAHAFPGEFDESILEKAIKFTQESGLIKRYQDLTIDKRYAPGFWAEALYYRCLAKSDFSYREWLAEAILQNYKCNIGFSPSLLGGNCEAIAHKKRMPILSIEDPRIFVANLSYGNRTEFLLVNLSDDNIAITNPIKTINNLKWKNSEGRNIDLSNLIIKGNDWALGDSEKNKEN